MKDWRRQAREREEENVEWERSKRDKGREGRVDDTQERERKRKTLVVKEEDARKREE